jgi:predicted ester cyclase
MTTPAHPSTTQKDSRQIQLEGTAAKLAELLGVDMSPDDLVRAVQESIQVEKNKETLLRFQHEVFNGNDWSTDTLARNLTPDFVDHAAMPGDPPGFDGVQLRFSGWAGAFEEAEEVNEAMVGQGDLLAVMYNLHAKHSGAFMGIEPTNREVVIPGMEIVRIRDNKIAEHWGIYDFLRTAEEVGAALTFVPMAASGASGDPKRPEVPWAVKMTEEDASGVGDAAEKYLRPEE